MDLAVEVYNERDKEIRTSELNAKLGPYIKAFPPRSKTHKEIKLNYITQLQKSPPVIGFFSNLPSEIEVNYKRFLEHKIRDEFGFTGVPLTLTFKAKHKDRRE
jgi:GTP-binding protein